MDLCILKSEFFLYHAENNLLYRKKHVSSTWITEFLWATKGMNGKQWVLAWRTSFLQASLIPLLVSTPVHKGKQKLPLWIQVSKDVVAKDQSMSEHLLVFV